MTVSALVAGFLGKAERALEEARLLLAAKRTEGACSRAYYAMFDAAHAALLAAGHETPESLIKTHSAMIGEFGRKIVLGGQIDAALGRALNRVETIRLLADYSAEPPPLEEAAWAVEQAGVFVCAVKSRFGS